MVGSGKARAARPSEGPAIGVRFRDLSVPDAAFRAELLAAVEAVLVHGRLILGPEVEAFERVLAQDTGRAFAVGVGSGSDALYLALRALGIGPGDEVITTPLSWVATLNAIRLAGATPVFVDIKPDLNIDDSLIEAAITPRTQAIVPVHFNGRLCAMDRIGAIAARHGIAVVEDAAQAYGARLAGRPAGSFGRAAAFSFNAMKVLPGYGEGGAVVTDDDEAATRLRALRYQGVTDGGEVCRWPALNARLDTIQAAMLLVGRRRCEAAMSRRVEIAKAYRAELAGIVECPAVDPAEPRRSVFFDYQIVAERREELRRFLAGRGIETKIKHPILMPDHPAHADLARPRLAVAESLVGRILCLPIHEKLTETDVRTVVDGVRAFHGGH